MNNADGDGQTMVTGMTLSGGDIQGETTITAKGGLQGMDLTSSNGNVEVWIGGYPQLDRVVSITLCDCSNGDT